MQEEERQPAAGGRADDVQEHEWLGHRRKQIPPPKQLHVNTTLKRTYVTCFLCSCYITTSRCAHSRGDIWRSAVGKEESVLAFTCPPLRFLLLLFTISPAANNTYGRACKSDGGSATVRPPPQPNQRVSAANPSSHHLTSTLQRPNPRG